MKDDMVVTSHINEVMTWLEEDEQIWLYQLCTWSECETEIYIGGLIVTINQDDYTFTAALISEMIAGRIKIDYEKIPVSKSVHG